MTIRPLLDIELDEAQTGALARSIARLLSKGDCLLLNGEVGAGKSSFARALIRAFLPDEEVPSPTFTLVQTYDMPHGRLSHYDLYRIEHAGELMELAIDEALEQGVCVMEWPDIAEAMLPDERLEIIFSAGSSEDTRRIEIRGAPGWQQRWPQLEAHC